MFGDLKKKEGLGTYQYRIILDLDVLKSYCVGAALGVEEL